MLSNYIKNKDFSVLISNFLSLSVLQFINMLLPLVTLPYLVRVLGVEVFGLVSFVLSIIMYFNIIVSFGFELSATQQISLCRDNVKKVGKIFSDVLATKLLLLIISAVILIVLVFSIDPLTDHAMLYIATFGIVIGNFLMPSWLFQGMENMKYITFANVISRGIFTALIFIFINDSSDFIYVPILNSLGAIIGGLYSMWLAFRLFRLPMVLPSRKSISNQIKYSSHFFLSRLANNGSRYYATTIIGICFGNITVGYYTMAEKLFYAFNSIGSVVSQAIYPFMARTKNIVFLKKILIFITGLALFLLCPVIYYHELILDIVFDVNNKILSIIFIIIFSGAIFSIVSSIIGFPLLAAFGHIKYANYSLIYSSIVYVLYLTIFAIFNPNIYFMTLGLPIYMLSCMLFRFYYVRKTNVFKLN